MPSRSKTSGSACSSGRVRSSETGSGARKPTQAALLDHVGAAAAARPRLERSGVGGEATRRGAEARARAEHPASRGEHAREVSPVQPVEPGGLEEGRPGAVGLDLGADRLEPVEHAVPERAHALRIGRDQPQGGAARHRLAQPHAPHDPERLGRRGDLPHHLLPARLGREGDRLRQQRPTVAQPREQLEAGVEDADDHTNTCSHPASAGCKPIFTGVRA